MHSGNLVVWPGWSQHILVTKSPAVKSKDSEARWPGLQILSMPFICCVTLSKSLSLSGLPFLYRRNETNSTALMGLCEGQINDFVNEECLRLTIAGGAVGTSAVGPASEGEGTAEGSEFVLAWIKGLARRPSSRVPRFSEGREAPPSGAWRGFTAADSGAGAGKEPASGVREVPGSLGDPRHPEAVGPQSRHLGGRPRGPHSDPQGSC